MNISLKPELEQWIQQKVESGQYHSASEVVEDALYLLSDRDLFKAMKQEGLRQELQRGMDSPIAGSLDVENIIRRGRERLLAKKAQES
ncbi:MAG: type II toxin-antitoxin system ParD family antitoxin [Cyanosarcina radialis HA8281-LM2]|nr:type II toxin-antitoxin system ParD family antitoxin [Cyanosarcina radialis HA8281-LM2]